MSGLEKRYIIIRERFFEGRWLTCHMHPKNNISYSFAYKHSFSTKKEALSYLSDLDDNRVNCFEIREVYYKK